MSPRFLAFLCAAACWGDAQAGAVSPRYSGVPVARVFTERELPGSPQTRVVLAQADGLVDVGNVVGLYQYDGQTWKTVVGTRSMIVHNLGTDSRGRLWYGAADGFGFVEPDATGTLTARPLQSLLPAADRRVGHILKMLVDRDDAYFVAGGAKGFVAHATMDGRVTELVPPRGERPLAVFARDGAAHVITPSHGYRIVGESLVAEPAADVLAQVSVRSVWPRDESSAWVVSAAGLRLWRGAQAPLVSEDVSRQLGADSVSCGCPLGDGTFALGTEQHGLLIVEAATGRILTQFDEEGGHQRSSSAIAALTLDREGGLWLSRFGGITRLQINSPAAIHDGLDGVRGRVQGFEFYHGRLHVATTRGVYVRDPGSGRFSELPGADGDTWVLLPVDDGLIVGGSDLRLIRDDGQVDIIERDRLIFRSALRLRRDPDRIVACTGPGLVRIYRRSGGVWRFETNLPNVRDSLYPIFEDRSGRLWATRNRREIVRLDWTGGMNLGARLQPVGPALGLPDPARHPARQNLFLVDGLPEVSSLEGIWRFDPDSGRFVPETRIAGLDVTHWSRAWLLSDGSFWLANSHEDGSSAIARRTGPGSWSLEPLPYTGLEVIRPLEVCDEPAAHTIWIGHLGLASFDRDWRGERVAPPVARLRGMATADGRLLWGGSGPLPAARLAPELNSLVFSFAAPTFQPDIFGAADARFRVKLGGFDHEWSPWNAAAQRDYSNLPPGRFSLLVQASDGAGRVGPTARYDFQLLPPWWLTWWWVSLELAAAIAVVFGLTRWYALGALRRRLALLEAQSALERERLRLARDLHDEVGSGLGRVILFAGAAEQAKRDPEKLDAALARIREASRDLMQHAREIIWAVSPQHDRLESVVERLGDYAAETLQAAGIACAIKWPAPEAVPSIALGSEARHSLFLALKEAVHNCVKYSGTKTVELTLAVGDGQFTFRLRDHGCGFAPGHVQGSGFGLANLAARAEMLGGRATVTSAPGQGTTVEVSVPLPASPPGPGSIP